LLSAIISDIWTKLNKQLSAAKNSTRNITVGFVGGQATSSSKAVFTAGMIAQHLSQITELVPFHQTKD